MAPPWDALVFHPDPLPLRVLQVFSIISTINFAIAEVQGHGVRYSKFASTENGSSRRMFPSRLAMAITYTPAASLCTAFLLFKLSFPPSSSSSASSHPAMLSFFAHSNPRLIILAVALTSHFIKRVMEVLLVHKYSGSMEVSTSLKIAFFYVMLSLNLLGAQQLSVQEEPPSINLMGWGLGLFMVGIVGNFYHHYLLACLRDNKKRVHDKKKRYMIPQGGLFTLVVCPHYLFECIGFLGLAMIGQTTSAFVNAISIFILLGSRSMSTKHWYHTNIEGFPKKRKSFIPFLL